MTAALPDKKQQETRTPIQTMRLDGLSIDTEPMTEGWNK